MLSLRLKGRWTPTWSRLSEHRVISSLFNVVIQTQRQMDPLCAKHCQSTEWSLHCSMLSFRFKGRWTPPSTLSEHRVISSLFNVVIETHTHINCLCAKDCQSTEWSLHCSMLSLRFTGRWTTYVQKIQSTEWSLHCSMLSFRFKGRWTPPSTLSEHRVISSLFNVVIETPTHMDCLCAKDPEYRVISSLFNVVIETQRQMKPLVNIVRAQSDLFTVQCCHSDSKADGPPPKTLSEHRVIYSLFNVVIQTQRKMEAPSMLSEQWIICSLFNVVIQTQRQMDPPSQHCQSTELSLHCSMLSFWLKVRWTPPSPLSDHRVISSLFNVIIQTQRQRDPTDQHCQSTEWSLHCSMLSLRLKGRWIPLQHCQSTELYLHCSMVSLRLKGRWTPQSTLSEHRVISSLFNVVIETQRKMDPTQSTQLEHRVISSLFNVVIETQRQRDPTDQHCQSTEWSLHCSMLSLRLKGRWNPWSTLSEHRVISSLFNVVIQTQRQMDSPQNTVRAQSDLFTVQCCHSDSKEDGSPFNAVRAMNYLFTVQCCHSDSKADGPPSTLSEHRVISSLFNVVIHTQRQMDPPWSTLSEHRVISSLFNGVIETQRQMDTPVNTVRAQNDFFTVQCCHSDSKADGPPMCKTLPEHRVISSLFNVVIQNQRHIDPLCAKHWLTTELSLHCSMVSLRLKGRWTPQSTLSEHRVISSLFNVVIQTQRKMDPTQSTQLEHRVISSLFNVVIETQRQRDPTDQHCQSTDDLFTVQCCHWDSKADGSHFNTVRAQSYIFTVQCCHSDSKKDGPPQSTQSENRVISSTFNVIIETQSQMDLPQSTLSEHRVISSLFNVVIQT